MFHISNDLRAKNSAQRICDALMACVKRKPFSEITVADLHKDYMISRTTFYRLFDNTVDVLEYSCDQMGRSILLNICGDTPRELTINAITALQGQQELIELLSSSGHLDILQKIGEKYIPLSRLAEGMDFGYGSEYFHRMLSLMIPMAIDIWAGSGRTDSPEELYEKLCRSIQMLGMWFSEAEQP
ncbi:MAG: hypothetical protein ACI4PO_02860 [Faecousia sp.]